MVISFSAHFDSKGIVEEYLHGKKLKERLPFTIVRFSFYFNNLASMMKPRKTGEDTYVYDIPMHGVPMDGIDVTQGGECVYGKHIYEFLTKLVRSRWLDIDEVEVHKLAKKERDQYPAILTEQTLSIKDLFYGFRGNFSCGIQRVIPSGQDSSILPAQVANHSAGSSFPLTELAV